MEHLNSPKDSHPQIEDLTDPLHDLESIRSNEDTYPSRPTSRLGFNQTTLSTISFDAASDSNAVQWSRSPFQNVGISDLRLSSIKPTKEDVMDSLGSADVANSALAPASREEIAIELPPSSPAVFPRSQAVPRKTPPVSRLCFPFVTTTSPKRKKPPPSPPPPTRHKHSCFPSPMSPMSAARPLPKHQRHCYSQHGYSRNALQHVKWFWSLREDGREGTEQNVSQEYGVGFSTPDPVHPSAFSSLRIDPIRQTAPPMTVHPRRGDISALRDPYCTQIDRCFVDSPTWTIDKVIWLYDLHMADAKRNAGIQDTSDGDSESDGGESESENELETSASTHSSDDSDATLVESENECDHPNLGTSTANAIPQGKTKFDKIQDAGDRSSPVGGVAGQSSSPLLSGRLILDRANWSRATKHFNSKSRIADNQKPMWATNWYHRWELLVDLARQDTDRVHVMFEGIASPLNIAPPLPSVFNDTSRSDGFAAGPSPERIAPPLNTGPTFTPDDTFGPYGFAIGSSSDRDSDNDAWMARLEAY